MNRRGFFKSFLLTPMLTPFILASQSEKKGFTLYIITDSPRLFLSAIIQELQKFGMINSHSFTLVNSHPKGDELRKALSRKGWSYVPKAHKADMSLSFYQLRQPAPPSFSLIKDGNVWDIRSRGLYTLWEEMNKYHAPSFWLTTASFKDKHRGINPGSSASIYIDGHRIEGLSLKKETSKSFQTKRGYISILVKNEKISVSDSSCRHKICLLSPPVSIAGERIICAPNHFLLEVMGSSLIDTVIG